MITDTGTSALAKQFLKDEISITAFFCWSLPGAAEFGYVRILVEGLIATIRTKHYKTGSAREEL